MYDRFWHDKHVVCHMFQFLDVWHTLSLSQVNTLLNSTCSSESYWKDRFLSKWSISDANWRGDDWKRAYMDGSHCKEEIWVLHSRWVSVTLVPNGNPIVSGDIDPSRLGTRVNCHQQGYTLKSARLGIIYRQPADPLPETEQRLQPEATTHRTCDLCMEATVKWGSGLHFLRDVIFSPTLLTVCPPSQCVWLANPSKTQPVAFRFVTSRPDLYAISPAVGFLLPGQAIEVLFYVCGGQWDKAQYWAVLDGNLCPQAFMLQYTTSQNFRRLESPDSFSPFTELLINPEEASGIRTMTFNVHHTLMPLEVNSDSWEECDQSGVQRSTKNRHQYDVSFQFLFKKKHYELMAKDAQQVGLKQDWKHRVVRFLKAVAYASVVLEAIRWAYVSAAFFAPKRLAPYCWHTVVGTLPKNAHNPDEIRRQQQESRRLAEFAQLENRTVLQPIWNVLSAYGGYEVLLHGYVRFAVIWVMMFLASVPLMQSCTLRYFGIIDYQYPGIFSSKELPRMKQKDPDSSTPEYAVSNLDYTSPHWCGIGCVLLLLCWLSMFHLGERRLKRWMQMIFMAIIGVLSFLLASPDPVINIATVMLQGAALALGTLLHDAEVGAVISRHSRSTPSTIASTLHPRNQPPDEREQQPTVPDTPFFDFNTFFGNGMACPTAAPSASYVVGALLLGQLVGCSGDVRFALDLGVVFHWCIGIPKPVYSEAVHWFFILLYTFCSWIVFAAVRRGVSRNFKLQSVSLLGFLAAVLIVAAWVILYGGFFMAIMFPPDKPIIELHNGSCTAEECVDVDASSQHESL